MASIYATMIVTYGHWLLNTISTTLGTGGISRPSEPPVSVRQLRAAIRTTSPAAKVERIKNGPRRRAHTFVNSAPAHPAIRAPASIPNHGGTPYFNSRIVDVYAPIPKNAAWPNEMRPAYPPAIFHASAKPAQRNVRIMMSTA